MILSKMCRKCGGLAALLLSSVLHAETILNLNAPDVDEDQAQAILVCASDFPDGTKAHRVHFKFYLPQFKAWAREQKMMLYPTKQRIRRCEALGGKMIVFVVTDRQAVDEVESHENGIGYTYGPLGRTDVPR